VTSIQNNEVNLTDPATTLALLKLNAVVGVVGFFDPSGNLTSVGITCALCHSTVDDSFAPGIGNRLDGWANRDLNVGAVINLAPNVTALTTRLGVDEATVRAVLNSWGPGKFDAELLHDGIAFRPDGESGATLIPPAFGMQGESLHTYTGWGSIPYWNAFVAITEMQGQGRFYDPRLNDPVKFPLDAKFGTWNITPAVDLVTSKLAPLHAYQLSLAAPTPPEGSYNVTAAAIGEAIFNGETGQANCATCHTPPLYSEPGWMMHNGSEIGIDNFQADRSPDGMYRTINLRGMLAHSQGGFFHDGRFATLQDVVLHYNSTFNLGLSQQDISDLVEFLKSL
jgi:cytochrome c peroxidase